MLCTNKKNCRYQYFIFIIIKNIIQLVYLMIKNVLKININPRKDLTEV